MGSNIAVDVHEGGVVLSLQLDFVFLLHDQSVPFLQ